MRRVFTAALILSLAILLIAGKIVGYVTDEYGSLTTACVRVKSEAFLKTTYTDWNGKFEIELPRGVYELEVSKGPEYERMTIDLKVEKDDQKEIWVELRRIVDLRRMGWFGGDAHLHTTYSDGRQGVEQVALACSAVGLSWAFLTDHNTVMGKNEWLSLSNRGILTILGQEVTTKKGHLNALGIKELVEWEPADTDEDFERIFSKIRSQGGLVMIAHPFDPKNPFEKLHVQDFDLIEIWNGGAPPLVRRMGNVEAVEYWYGLLNKGKRIPGIANSDCHDVFSSYSMLGILPIETVVQMLQGEIGDQEMLEYIVENEEWMRKWVLYGLLPGTPRTYVKVKELTAENILESLKNGRSFMTNGPILLVDVNGVGPGEVVPASDRLQLNIIVASNVPVNSLRVIQGGKTVYLLNFPDRHSLKCTLEVDPKDGDWLIVEVSGEFPVWTLTNPVYLR